VVTAIARPGIYAYRKARWSFRRAAPSPLEKLERLSSCGFETDRDYVAAPRDTIASTRKNLARAELC